MKQRSSTFSEVEQIVKLLEHQQAWRSRAGSGTGSIFTLQFGPALFNDHTQGEFSLMVYCAWRIVEGSTTICTWREDAESILAPMLKDLEGAHVSKANLSEWGDLTIDFNIGHSLQIWSEAHSEYPENWSIGYQGSGHYSMEIGKGFIYEKSEPQAANGD
ncbi:hypothetical protein [Hymenobacter wooponensis]|uniref:Uncharacterized protein n=1 Tax=Hymenobacter wooponensis TaxID=1525360 RepID=A0A4Z0MLT6_9BACT|nr:hypothetical protein [Hymenobacter wooponensis]TGD80446.1 hypothetical protein EU557_11445 [Hymenobacter wooponensis]